VLRLASAFRVLAVHDLRLPRVQLEPQGPEPLGERVPQPPGLLLGVAVDNNVVRVALEGAARVFPEAYSRPCVVSGMR
jgi:hypothetical protein